jgi:uncharacterized protein YqeY
MTDLQIRIREDLRAAMKNRDLICRDTLRLVQAEIKNAEIEKREALDSNALISLLQKQVKQRQESIIQFERGGRQDLVEREQAELEILEKYLPKQISRDEIAAVAEQVIIQVGAMGPQDKGKVMGPMMAEIRGKADGRLVNQVVTELLSLE